MKKKIIMSLLAASLVVTTVGCGLEAAVDNGPKEEVAVSEDTSDEASDAAASTEDESEAEDDVVIKVVEGQGHTAEYEAAFSAAEGIGGPYRMTGASEVSEFDDWKEGYKALVEDLSSDNDEVKFAVVYVNDDDIPELVYTPYEDNMIIATFGGSTVNLFGSQLSTMSYIERDNALFASERVGATYGDYVVAIDEYGSWIKLAYGTRGPLDEWAEDSFDENGEPIISHWTINDEEIKNQGEYDDLLSKYFDSSNGKEIVVSLGADDVIEELEAL